nr:MAG TPA: hypothetical protein [Caudoviricetes sp.]
MALRTATLMQFVMKTQRTPVILPLLFTQRVKLLVH